MTVAKLIDDPFRSLAGELRRAGGFAKDTTPFSEFLWADFLRRRVERKTVEAHFQHALEKALELAKEGGGELPARLVWSRLRRGLKAHPPARENRMRAKAPAPHSRHSLHAAPSCVD